MGIYHTQSRADRDKFVDIIEDNIIAKYKRNFKKFSDEVIHSHGLEYETIVGRVVAEILVPNILAYGERPGCIAEYK